ncbi:MAG: DUF5009 domain-containing protein [Planctomycetaceae bacterium]|nr:DUF5009 domain-containing protein [Planctomycetaceae bacterium]
MNSVDDAAAPAPLAITPAASPRLMSLDALRGFDMFWIMGGENIIKALAELTGWSAAVWASQQLVHVKWDGFVFYDLIFPLFLFMAGVAMPFSLTRRREQGADRKQLVLQVVRRGLILVMLGIIYNNGLFQKSLAETRFPSVLGRIGLASMFAGLIVLHTRLRGQIVWFAGLLLVYWAAMMLIPVPGFGAGNLTQEGSLAGYVDRHLIPGRLYLGNHDPEGLFSTIPAIATALLGVFAGTLLRSDRPGLTGFRKGLLLAAGGLASLAVGTLWGEVFPINKNLWTSSFALIAGGWSLLLLALFYVVIDVWNFKRWAFPFVVIGVNSILIYMSEKFIDFDFTANFLIGGLIQPLGPQVQKLWLAITIVAIEWGFLYFLYRKRVFLKV